MDFAVIVLQCNGIIIIFGAVRVRSNNTKWQKDKLLATMMMMEMMMTIMMMMLMIMMMIVIPIMCQYFVVQ